MGGVRVAQIDENALGDQELGGFQDLMKVRPV